MFFSSSALSNPELKPTYWKTIGHGYVLEVINEVMTVYDVTSSFCIKNEFVTSFYIDTPASKLITTNGNDTAEIDWYALHPTELVLINKLPDKCISSNNYDLDPVKNFDVFWQTYANNFPYSKEHKWDWKKKYPLWRSLITRETNEEELADIFSKVINSVRDGHASLVGRDGEEIGDIKARLLTHEYRLRKAWRKDENYQYLWPFVRAYFKKWEENIQQNYAKERRVESYYDNFLFFSIKQ